MLIDNDTLVDIGSTFEPDAVSGRKLEEEADGTKVATAEPTENGTTDMSAKEDEDGLLVRDSIG